MTRRLELADRVRYCDTAEEIVGTVVGFHADGDPLVAPDDQAAPVQRLLREHVRHVEPDEHSHAAVDDRDDADGW